jgi:hypothetical protein
MQFLLPVSRQNPENFLVQVQYATAMFLTSNWDFRKDAYEHLKPALDAWPKQWDGLTDPQKQFFLSLGWEETAFERFRRYEEYFSRLVRHRIREDKLARKKTPLPEMVDPIFDEDPEKSVRFVNDSGRFEVGRIKSSEAKKLPRDSVEAVQQLLIWMPNDQRLQWLLGEVFNARAMEHQQPTPKDQGDREQAIKSAFLIFAQLNDPLNRAVYGTKQIQERYTALKDYVDKIQPVPFDLGNKFKDDDEAINWRIPAVSFVAGFAVGIFALWQMQETRRRRQARLAARG